MDLHIYNEMIWFEFNRLIICYGDTNYLLLSNHFKFINTKNRKFQKSEQFKMGCS